MDKVFGRYSIAMLNPTDSTPFFNLLNNNRSRLEDFFAGTVAKTKTLEDTQAYCQVIAQKIQDKIYYPYIISQIDNGAFVGMIDVKNIDWSIPKAEIGYMIDADFEGKGVVAEAFSYVVKYLVDTHSFKKIFCRVGTKNLKSIGVVLKNGFELEGTIRKDYKTTRGEIVDLNYYGRVF